MTGLLSIGLLCILSLRSFKQFFISNVISAPPVSFAMSCLQCRLPLFSSNVQSKMQVFLFF